MIILFDKNEQLQPFFGINQKKGILILNLKQ